MSLVSKNEIIMDASEIADASEIGALHTRIAKMKTAEIARQKKAKKNLLYYKEIISMR